jgi:hypothetical protein
MAYVYKDGERINLDSNTDYTISYSWEGTDNLWYPNAKKDEKGNYILDEKKLTIAGLKLTNSETNSETNSKTNSAYYVKLTVSIKEAEAETNSNISLSKTTDVYCYYPIDVLVSDNYSAE